MAANNRSAGEQGAGGAVARGLAQLKEKVKELTLRLEREIKARKLDARLGMEAKKVRDQLTKETKILLEHGRKLAAELKSTLGDASKRDNALKEARAKVAELKDELGRFCSGPLGHSSLPAHGMEKTLALYGILAGQPADRENA
jgi:hypothetical protein